MKDLTNEQLSDIWHAQASSGNGSGFYDIIRAAIKADRELNGRAGEARPVEQSKGQDVAKFFLPPALHDGIAENTAGTYRLRVTGLTIRQIKDIFEDKFLGSMMWSNGAAYPTDGVEIRFLKDQPDTTPPAHPAREWVGLTEFEIASAMTGQPEVGISFQALCSIARAIESASREKNAGLPAADDASDNAPWLTEAHILCTDHGIPMGHITERIRALREKLADDKAGGEPVTGRDLFVAWWDGYGMQPGVECSLPVWKYQETAIQSAWNHVATRYYPNPQPQAEVRVPDGYVLVPVEPTDDMLNCAQDRVYSLFRVDACSIWDAMLAAAPKPKDDLPTILKKQAS